MVAPKFFALNDNRIIERKTPKIDRKSNISFPVLRSKSTIFYGNFDNLKVLNFDNRFKINNRRFFSVICLRNKHFTFWNYIF